MEKDKRLKFEQIFKGLFEPLCGFTMKYTRDLEEAKNLVHEVFISLWEKFESLPDDTNFRSYLYTSCRNRSLNYLRDRKLHLSVEQVDNSSDTDASSGIEARELQTEIEWAINSLPQKCRMVFEMSRFEELTYAEIAAKMEISVKTVEAQMTKALSVLRNHLADFLSLLIFFIFISKGIW